MKTTLMLTLLLLMLGCVSIKPVDKATVGAICNAEYDKMNEKVSGKASYVSFRIEPAGTLLPKARHKKDKAERDAKEAPKDLFSAIMAAGHEFPDIGARAAFVGWTDSESITFTTSDEVYDIGATLCFESDRIPIDMKQLARYISDTYNKTKASPTP